MTISMYELTIPVIKRTLNNLKGVIQIGTDYIQANNLEEQEVFNSRLAEDMLPLCAQIRIVTDFSKACAYRLTGQEPPIIPDDEQDFSALLQRIDTVKAMIKAFEPDQFEGSEHRTIVTKTPFGEVSFDGQAYAQHFVLPNLFFHATTTYNLFRKLGVPLSKLDFMGAR